MARASMEPRAEPLGNSFMDFSHTGSSKRSRSFPGYVPYDLQELYEQLRPGPRRISEQASPARKSPTHHFPAASTNGSEEQASEPRSSSLGSDPPGSPRGEEHEEEEDQVDSTPQELWPDTDSEDEPFWSPCSHASAATTSWADTTTDSLNSGFGSLLLPWRTSPLSNSRPAMATWPGQNDAERLESTLLAAERALAALEAAEEEEVAALASSEVTSTAASTIDDEDQEAAGELCAGAAQQSSGAASDRREPARPESATDAASEEEDVEVTSLMLRNIPSKVTQRQLIDEIHASGFADRCDFCYMPRNFNSGENQGHAFVNFVTEEAASDFHKAWHRQRPFRTNKNQPAINISAADLQGLSANLSKWDNPRMRRVRNPIYKPFMLEPTDVEQQVDGGSDEMARRRERRYLPAAASRPSSFIE